MASAPLERQFPLQGPPSQTVQFDKLAVARPRLPVADSLTPYLREIDGNRWYSNFGPLAARLEARLADYFGVGADEIVLVANCTAGMTLSLMAMETAPGGLCLTPSWSFTATSLAALQAGLVPYYVDVDKESQMLTPAAARRALDGAPGNVAAILPVAAFGAPVDVAAWDALAMETGVPVLIDAAAAFHSWRPGRSLAAISLHATKLLGVGEGGLVVGRDAALIRAVRQRSNFGFLGSRDTRLIGFNGKFDEYNAAVGLAALDELPENVAAFRAVADAYQCRLADDRRIRFAADFGRSWISTTMTVITPEHQTDALAVALADSGIETRAWWGRGAHAHAALAALPRGELPNTEWLGRHSIGLPFAADMNEDEVDRVCVALLRSLGPKISQESPTNF